MQNEPLRLLGTGAALVALLGLGGVLARHVRPALADTNAGMTIAQQQRLEKVASASLFGQFRTSLSDYLWLKTDKYMHRGVELRGLTKQEQEHGDKGDVHTAANDSVNIQHEDETTVVPSKSQDWRGHLGDIEREISPYTDMSNHSHGEPRETIPLFRLMTWSNPHFIKGYVVGWSIMAQDRSHLDDALAFLQEGAANNPESIEIQTEIGSLLTFRKKQYDAAMPYLYQAIKLGAARDPATMNEDEQAGWEYAYRWAVLNRRDVKDHTTARRLATEGIKLFPEDVVMSGYLKKYHP